MWFGTQSRMEIKGGKEVNYFCHFVLFCFVFFIIIFFFLIYLSLSLSLDSGGNNQTTTKEITNRKGREGTGGNTEISKQDGEVRKG